MGSTPIDFGHCAIFKILHNTQHTLRNRYFIHISAQLPDPKGRHLYNLYRSPLQTLKVWLYTFACKSQECLWQDWYIFPFIFISPPTSASQEILFLFLFLLRYRRKNLVGIRHMQNKMQVALSEKGNNYSIILTTDNFF